MHQNPAEGCAWDFATPINHANSQPAGIQCAAAVNARHRCQQALRHYWLPAQRVVYLADEVDMCLIRLILPMLNFLSIIFQTFCYTRLNPVRVTYLMDEKFTPGFRKHD